MKRILVAWELGANFGHLAQLRPIAELMRTQGYDVTFAVRDLTHARRLLGQSTFKILGAPAPVQLRHQMQNKRPPNSYLDILAMQGATDYEGLSAIVSAWRDLLDLGSFDLVLAESAPFAAIAASLLGLPHLVLGTGFTLPPADGPFPPFRCEAQESREHRLQTEADVLAALNLLAHAHGRPLYSSSHEIFRSARRCLMTWPELDHYGPREGSEYFGPLPTSEPASEDVGVDWQPGRRRVVGYLQPDYPQLGALLHALEVSHASAIIVVPGGDRWVKHFASPTIRIFAERVKFESILPDADFIVCHGSHNLVAEALYAGKPLLMLPHQIEQAMLARRAQAAQFGVYVSPAEVDRLPELVRHMQAGHGRDACATFARGKRRDDPHAAVREIFALATTMLQ